MHGICTPFYNFLQTRISEIENRMTKFVKMDKGIFKQSQVFLFFSGSWVLGVLGPLVLGVDRVFGLGSPWVGSWVLGLGSWFLGLGSWVLGLGSWVLGLLGSCVLGLGLGYCLWQDKTTIKL